MKQHAYKFLSVILAVITFSTCFITTAFGAKKFSPIIETDNIGVTTQYIYEENNPSWLRQLTIKENMLSVDSITTELTLYPVATYPYRTDAACFKEEVQSYVEAFTLDEEGRKAAYIYVLNQIGALSLITEEPEDGVSKADWLREHGIIITKEEENDPDSTVMINALYSLMKNDFYYVITGERLDIPDGTPLQSAVMIYLIAMTGQNSTLTKFMQKYFEGESLLTLEDYIYYTSLLALFTSGYVTVKELPTITHEEVYRRLAIKSIREYGIAVDDTASTEELQIKYLAAMLGEQYEITIDPQALVKEVKNDTVAFYIIRRMAYEDAKLTLSPKQYSYEEAFEIVCNKTTRFNLENKFYSDIFEYNVYLGNIRESVYINPNPISSSDVSVLINGKSGNAARYNNTPLSGKSPESVGIRVNYNDGTTKKSSYYKINFIQGSTPATDVDLTGYIKDIGNVTIPDGSTPVTIDRSLIPSVPVSEMNEAVPSLYFLADQVLSLNENGQLVDANGNLVSDKTFEPLPAGYKYALDDAGNITIVPISAIEESTEPTTEQELAEGDSEKLRYIVIAISVFLLLVLLIIIAVVIKVTSDRKKKGIVTKKDKERAKKAKKELKAEKKNAKKNKKK